MNDFWNHIEQECQTEPKKDYWNPTNVLVPCESCGEYYYHKAFWGTRYAKFQKNICPYCKAEAKRFDVSIIRKSQEDEAKHGKTL